MKYNDIIVIWPSVVTRTLPSSNLINLNDLLTYSYSYEQLTLGDAWRWNEWVPADPVSLEEVNIRYLCITIHLFLLPHFLLIFVSSPLFLKSIIIFLYSFTYCLLYASDILWYPLIIQYIRQDILSSLLCLLFVRSQIDLKKKKLLEMQNSRKITVPFVVNMWMTWK